MADPARFLLLGGNADVRSRTAALLAETGSSTASIETVEGIPPLPFDLVVVLESDAAGACAALRARPSLGRALIVAVGEDLDEPAVRAAGADEVLRERIDPGILSAFVRGAASALSDRGAAEAARLLEEALIEVLRLAAEPEINEALRGALGPAARAVGHARASMILVSELLDQAYVVAASEDPTVEKIAVDLDRYPEVRQALSGGEPLIVPDVGGFAPLGPWMERLKLAGVRSSAIFPMEWRGRMCGVVFFRSPEPVPPMDARRIAFARVVAGILAQRVAGGALLESIREQTHRLSLARYETERRLRAIDQLRDYFEASSEGVLVVDGDGQILFVNRAAVAITGYARESLGGKYLADFVPEVQKPGLQQVIIQVLSGTNLETFDLHLATTSGDSIIVSVATSTVLHDHGAAILSFRDVTGERALETELRKTKEFLEKLIDSAVDAIVAADVQGNVILFNPGAERLFGWRAEEVLGQLSVEKLYPDGIGRQVMRMLRSASYGGVGRLEVTRREIVTKEGEIVPVNMTASIIYEDGREVATVGILADLRERIRIEQRLLQAQEKLLVTEKQALVAELAGATAHELNQPLTSVMGYAELLKKKMKPDEPYHRAVDTILREATRMAEIVKQIGRITKYETKAYVGSAQILDLEKSSGRGEG